MILLNKSSSLIKYLKVSAIAEVDMWRSRFGRKSRRDLKKSSTRRHTTWYRYQSWVKQRVLSTFILSILFRSVAFRVPGLACGKRRNVTVGYTSARQPLDRVAADATLSRCQCQTDTGSPKKTPYFNK